MIHLHPAISHAPVLLLLVVFLLEIFRESLKVSEVTLRVLVWLSAGSIAATFFSGYNASNLAADIRPLPDAVISLHHIVGRSLLFLTAPLIAVYEFSTRAAFNRGLFRTAYLFLLVCACAGAALAGYLGGELVFSHGVGVTFPNTSPTSQALGHGEHP